MGTFMNDRGNEGDDTHGDNVGPAPVADRNILAFPDAKERQNLKKNPSTAREPLINMPPATLSLIGIILAVQIYVAHIATPDQAAALMSQYGFVPTAFDGGLTTANALSLFTHMFLHGSWLHVSMNLLMLAAFGSGVERWLGARRMLVLFFVSGLFGAAFHYVLNTGSPFPMIGASGALSGLFAAAIVMLSKGQREMGGRFGILPFALIWIGLSIAFGMLGGPDGSIIAWAAHVGGFLGGFAVLKAMRV